MAPGGDPPAGQPAGRAGPAFPSSLGLPPLPRLRGEGALRAVPGQRGAGAARRLLGGGPAVRPAGQAGTGVWSGLIVNSALFTSMLLCNCV